MSTSSSATCSICSDCLMKPKTPVNVTNCGHVFHASCLRQFIGQNLNICPSCHNIITLIKDQPTTEASKEFPIKTWHDLFVYSVGCPGICNTSNCLICYNVKNMTQNQWPQFKGEVYDYETDEDE